jgi:hypothetical protein
MSLRSIATLHDLEMELVRYLNSLCVEPFDSFVQKCGVQTNPPPPPFAPSCSLHGQHGHADAEPPSEPLHSQPCGGEGQCPGIESFGDLGVGTFRLYPIVRHYFGTYAHANDGDYAIQPLTSSDVVRELWAFVGGSSHQKMWSALSGAEARGTGSGEDMRLSARPPSDTTRHSVVVAFRQHLLQEYGNLLQRDECSDNALSTESVLGVSINADLLQPEIQMLHHIQRRQHDLLVDSKKQLLESLQREHNRHHHGSSCQQPETTSKCVCVKCGGPALDAAQSTGSDGAKIPKLVRPSRAGAAAFFDRCEKELNSPYSPSFKKLNKVVKVVLKTRWLTIDQD